ncbi:MAG: aldo/keto reductase, partial [Deltaproteobacteria bacterium]|nr:aldo/keto reductase [Deltaproteobacteria bacterium]
RAQAQDATAQGSTAPGSTAPDGNSAPLPTRPLGKSGLKVPILMQGTAQRLDSRFDKVLHFCFRNGVTAFDTARSYGWGSSHGALKTFIGQIGDRKKLWITSKSGSGSPEGLAEDLDDALKELGTDYLDLYLMHGIGDTDMLDKKFLQAGERLKKTGKTRLFGYSCHDGAVVETMEHAARSGGIDAILFRYNFRRYGDKELNRAMDAAHKAGIGLIAMKTHGGVSISDEAEARFKSKNFTLGQAKLKSVWADERIASVCSEMDSMAVARENITAARSPQALSAAEAHGLNRLAAQTAHLSCQGCASLCEGALGHRASIADPLRFLMYHQAYGDADRARRLYRALPPEKLALQGLDLEQARTACPQGIDIAARLKLAHRLLA